MKIRMNALPLVAAVTILPLLPLTAFAGPGAAHVHGRAQVEIAVDGPVMQLTLKSPLESLVGFEHAPRTPAQQRAMRDMVAAFRQPAQLFAPTAGAQCKAEPAEVAAPTAVGTAHAHAEHAEMETTFTFRCLVPTALRSVHFDIFNVFPRLQRIDVQLVGSKGQTAATLTPKQRSLSW